MEKKWEARFSYGNVLIAMSREGMVSYRDASRGKGQAMNCRAHNCDGKGRIENEKMEMSAEEIVRSYREALDKKHQIEVLADLNVCRKEDIVEVLKENGVKPQELPRKSKKKAVAMVAADVRAYEAEGKKALVKEALEALCGRLQKEYDNLRAEWENISAEYLSKINAIQVMMEEDLK